jgi:hypothetical protein
MATGEAATRPAVDEVCPVCLAPVVDEPECAYCRWGLEGPVMLGPLTPEIRRAFDQRLVAARRRLDLTAAARAAGYPGRGEPERLARLAALVRGGAPRPAEREAVVRELADEDTAAPERSGRLPDGSVVEITVRGLRSMTVLHGVEAADTTEWPWPGLVPGLPQDADESLFRLAGGIGDRATTASEPREPADLTASADVLVSRLPGWAVPERLLARLVRRFPTARTLYLAAEAPESAPFRHEPGFTAVGHGSVPDSDDVLLVGGSQDGSVTVWRLGQSRPLASRALHDKRVTCVDLTEDGRAVVSGGQDGAVRLWSFGGSGRVRVLAWHDGWVNALRQRAGVVFSLGDDAQVHRSRLDVAGTDSASLTRVGWASATALEVTPDRRVVIVGGSDGASLWDGGSGKRIGRLGGHHEITCLALAPRDRTVALGCADGVTRVFALGDPGTPISETDGHTGAVRQVAFGPGGALATADDAGTVRLRTGDGPPEVIGSHPDRVRGLTFTPDGRLLSAGADGLVRTWPRSEHH